MTIDQMLDDARAQIDRMYVFQLTEAFHRGAIFVDIRPQAQALPYQYESRVGTSRWPPTTTSSG